MNPEEYTLMYHVEETHWWYRGLRGMIWDALKTYGPSSPYRVLDIGCGTGATLSRLTGEALAVGVDVSTTALKHSRERGITALGNASAIALPFADRSFDCVLIMDVLYHRGVPDKVAALREAQRVLVQGGVLLVNVPAYEWLRSAHDHAVHTDKRFTRSEVAALLQQAALSPTRLTYWNTLLFPAVALVRLLRKGGNDSDLDEEQSAITNAILNTVLSLERMLLRFAPMPFGLSIFAVAFRSNDNLLNHEDALGDRTST